MKTRLLSLLIFLSVTVTGHTDTGDYDIYIRVAGGAGESMDARHKGWSEVLGFTHHIGEGATSSFGYRSGRTSTLPDRSFELIKRIDSITPFLSEATASNMMLPQVEIEVCPKGMSNLVVLRYELQGVQVTYSTVTGDTKDQDASPLDIVELTYTNLTVTDNRPAPEGGGEPSGIPQPVPEPPPPSMDENPNPPEQEPEECPDGSFWNGEFCEPPGEMPCPPGQYREGEHCVCPEGSFWNGELCAPHGEVLCPPGQYPEGERCVCPEGSLWNGGICEPRREAAPCPRGQQREGARCVCPEGSFWNGEFCEPGGEAPCPPGQQRDGERCVCPEGLLWNGETCEPREARCPPGQHHDGRRCVCPQGSHWNGQDCIPSEDIPDRMKHLLD